LTNFISRLAGLEKTSVLGELPQRISEATHKLIQQDSNKRKLALSHKIAYSQAVSGLVRYKETRLKGVTTRHAIHLTRPTQKVELIWEIEKHLAQELDRPWEDMSKLSAAFQDGVPLDKLDAVRTEYKKLYAQQFEINDKLNEFCARRRDVFKHHIAPPKKGMPIRVTNRSKADLVSEIAYKFSEKSEDKHLQTDIDNLSPIHFMSAIGKIQTWAQVTRSGSMRGGLTTKYLRDQSQGYESLSSWIAEWNSPELISYLELDELVVTQTTESEPAASAAD